MPSITFNDWSKGDFGTMDRRVAGKKPGYFEALNMKVYSDGLIGPRPGLKKVATDDWSTNGVVWGLFFTASTGEELVMVVGDKVYRAAVTTTTENLDTFEWTQLTGTLAASATDWITFDRFDPTEVFMVSPDDKAYVLDLAGSTVTAIASSPGGWVIRLWRDRLYISSHDNDSNTWRIWYSDAGDFTTIGASNYFDVGYWWPIWSMTPIRNGLLLGTQGAGWWVLTGSPASGTLRQVSSRGEPDKPNSLVIDDLERIWFIPDSGRPLAVTDGSTWDFDTYEHLVPSGTVHHGDFSYGNRDIMFLTTDGSNEALAMHNDVWVKYDFGVSLSGPITRYSADFFLMCGGDSASTPADFYWFANNLERPGFVSDDNAQPGDNSTTPLNAYLYTPEFVSENGKQVKVTQVTIDFIKYDTGSATNNNMTVGVRACSVYQTADDIDSDTISWSDDPDNASTSGISESVTKDFFTPWANGFQIRITAIKGVKIKSIHIEYEEESVVRPGALASATLTND